MPEQTIRRTLSHTRWVREVLPLIDLLRDPFSPGRQPVEYAEAYRDISLLVCDDNIWAALFEVAPGAKSNYALHNLGIERVEWLKAFREQVLAKRKVVNG